MTGQANEGAIANDASGEVGVLQGECERGRGQLRLGCRAQLFPAHALYVGVFRMKRSEAFEQAIDEAAPVRPVERDAFVTRLDDERIDGRHDLVERHGGQGAVPCEGPQVANERRRVEQGDEARRRIGDRERRALRFALGRASLPRGRMQVEECAATHRASGGYVTQHESIPRRRGDRTIEDELHVRVAARQQLLTFQQDDARTHFGRPVVKTRGEPLADRPGFSRQEMQPCIDTVGGRMQEGIDDHVAAMDRILADAVTGEVQGAAITRAADLYLPVLRVQ